MHRWLVFLVIGIGAVVLPASRALAADPIGSAVLSDTITQGDTLVVTMSGLSPAPGGSHYEGWLRPSDSSERTDLGAVPVGADGAVNFKYVSPRSENLLGANVVFELSVEPDGSSGASPSGAVTYRGQLSDALVPAVREMLFRWPESRFGTPAAEGVLEDAKLLQATAQQLQQAAAAGDLAGAKRSAERLVNTVEGQNGAKFGDMNGDGMAEGPGDGTGLLNYAWGAYWRARLAADAAPGDAWVAGHTGNVVGSTQQLINWAGFIRDNGLQFQAVGNAAQAQKQAQALKDAADRVLNGFDANGDGKVDVVGGEGGAVQVLQESQFLAAFRVNAVS